MQRSKEFVLLGYILDVIGCAYCNLYHFVSQYILEFFEVVALYLCCTCLFPFGNCLGTSGSGTKMEDASDTESAPLIIDA